MSANSNRSQYPWKEGQEKHAMSIRIPKDLFIKLDQMSLEDGYSINAVIIFMLEEMFGLLDFDHPSLPTS